MCQHYLTPPRNDLTRCPSRLLCNMSCTLILQNVLAIPLEASDLAASSSRVVQAAMDTFGSLDKLVGNVVLSFRAHDRPSVHYIVSSRIASYAPLSKWRSGYHTDGGLFKIGLLNIRPVSLRSVQEVGIYGDQFKRVTIVKHFTQSIIIHES